MSKIWHLKYRVTFRIMLIKLSVVSLMALCLLGYGVGAKPRFPKILDEQPTMSIEELLELACTTSDGYTHQISRLSTMRNLAMFLSTRSQIDGGNYDKCKEENQEALTRLREVIEASEDDLCSEEKIALIEDYHTDFISTYWRDMLDRKDNNKRLAPKMIAMFFMHYAVEVSSICKKNLVPNLDELTKRIGGQDEVTSFANGQDMEQLMKKAFPGFNSVSEVRDYDDIFLVWDLMSDMLMANDEEIPGDDLDNVTGESIKMMAKMKMPKPVIELKEKCQSKLRPVYSKVILPIIRLSNLGYQLKQSSKEDLERLRSNELVRRWYGITQICETILPIKFYQDNSMNEGTIAVLNKEQARNLSTKSENTNTEIQVARPEVDLKLTRNVMDDIDTVSSVLSMEDQTLLKNYKANLSSRDRVTKRMLARFTEEFKQNIKNFFGKIFFPFEKVGAIATAVSGSVSGENIEMEDMSKTLSDSLRDINSKDLFEMDIFGAAGKGRVKGPIERKRKRKPLNDGNLDKSRNEKLSYMHTKSFSDIIADWRGRIKKLAPKRRTIVFWGTYVIVTLVLCLLVVLIAAF